MDSRRAFWPAGSGTIVRGSPPAPVTESISPIIAKQTDSDEKFEDGIEEKGKGGEEDQEKKDKDEADENRRKDRVRREQPGASLQELGTNVDDTTELAEGLVAANPGTGLTPINAEIPEADIEVRKRRTATKPT